MSELILTLSCPDRVGIVHAVAGFLAERSCNIVDSQQFGDRSTGRFFMRVHVEASDDGPRVDALRAQFRPIAGAMAMDWALDDVADRGRVAILVSKEGHCLNDLLYRHRTGALPADIAFVASNHRDLEGEVDAAGVPFHHLPVTPDTRADQEGRLLDLIETDRIDLVVLARYMQILSGGFLERVGAPVINIHHSFLPAFAGAGPYARAKERGVKLVGATAHYVTEDLDEGPIIEQDVIRVSHRDDVDTLTRLGADIERTVLARAVRWHCEDRVLVSGSTTVVF